MKKQALLSYDIYEGIETRDLQAILEYTCHGEMIICQGIVYEFT